MYAITPDPSRDRGDTGGPGPQAVSHPKQLGTNPTKIKFCCVSGAVIGQMPSVAIHGVIQFVVTGAAGLAARLAGVFAVARQEAAPYRCGPGDGRHVPRLWDQPEVVHASGR